MFTVGEFSKIARVSKRLLRYYDQIDLFSPISTNEDNGYRLYEINQLPELNRIIALKDLGLSLAEIQSTVNQNITEAELERLLLIKKSEIERSVESQLQTIQRIESRLEISKGQNPSFDIVIKDLPTTRYYNFEQEYPSLQDAIKTVRLLVGFKSQTEFKLDNLMFIGQDDGFESSDLTMRIGFIANELEVEEITVPTEKEHIVLELLELPAHTEVASVIFHGNTETAHTVYGFIGGWMEKNDYKISGKWREVLLAPPNKNGQATMEIQVPISKNT